MASDQQREDANQGALPVKTPPAKRVESGSPPEGIGVNLKQKNIMIGRYVHEKKSEIIHRAEVRKRTSGSGL
jgi:hypothetical protein